jgi:hypothetical protein
MLTINPLRRLINIKKGLEAEMFEATLRRERKESRRLVAAVISVLEVNNRLEERCLLSASLSFPTATLVGPNTFESPPATVDIPWTMPGHVNSIGTAGPPRLFALGFWDFL